MNYTPEQENKIVDDSEKLVFYYCDESGTPVHKAKEIYKKQKKVILYPYSVSRESGIIRIKKIKEIEFRGWSSVGDIPQDFRKTKGYGFSSQRLRFFLSVIYQKFREVEKLIIDRYGTDRFYSKTITFSWITLDLILNKINKDHNWYIKNRKLFVGNEIAKITPKVEYKKRYLYSGELTAFLKKFDSCSKISSTDVDSLAQVIEDLPSSKISITSHFIKTKERIDTIYLESLIEQFEQLQLSKNDNEEKWQQFFERNAWILTHLFSYQVILKKGKAYIGGKTLENEEGRIVDFLFESGFKDNFALLELKTHKKELLKKTPYRKPDVYAISDELSGGINQCLDQKDTLVKDFGARHKTFDPKCILVIGKKNELNENQSKCFELYRANHKHVDVVTFDELLEKLKGLQRVLANGNGI